MADQQATPAAGPTVVCIGCGSPDVTAMDWTGAPVCGLCRRAELASLETLRDSAVAHLESVATFLVDQEGAIHPDDALAAFGEAVQAAAENRQARGLRVVPTIAETTEAADAFHRYEQLEEGGGRA
jgi:hypothetical protein